MNTPLTLQAAVKDAKADLSDWQKKRVIDFLRKREGQQIQITMRDAGKPRSLRQNAYAWGVVYQIIADETGHTTEEVHEFMKNKFLPRQFVEIGGEELSITKSTTALNTTEMADYLDRVIAFASSELGISIPPPGYAE